jgi:hypothetical protein
MKPFGSSHLQNELESANQEWREVLTPAPRSTEAFLDCVEILREGTRHAFADWKIPVFDSP